jgi:hypothetical protein
MAEFLSRAQLRRRNVRVPPLTSREESLDSHIMAFATEKSRRAGQMIEPLPRSCQHRGQRARFLHPDLLTAAGINWT